MKEITEYISEYLKGKSVYSPIIRFLNFYLSASIASSIFKRIYFNYSLIDLTDFKGIYNYFINGDFAVALLLFTIVHYGIGIVGESLFSLMTLKKTTEWTSRILKFKIKKKDYASFFKAVNNNPIAPTPIKFDKGVLVKYFEILKTSVSTEDWEKAKKTAGLKKEEIKNNFKLVFKGTIGLTIFFKSVTYFGWILYSVSMLLSLAGMIFFFYSYIILDISPLLIRKMDAEMTRLIQEYNSSVNSEQE
jgi:hypothetical protein